MVDITQIDITPTTYHVVVELEKIEETTKSGIIVASEAIKKEQTGAQFARILSVGPIAFRDTDMMKWSVMPQIGDIILISRYTGERIYSSRVDISDEKLANIRIINDEDVLAIIKETKD